MNESDLTEAGRTLVADIARRQGVGVDTVLILLEALERGGGHQAQFSHPELGGMGQWSRGGMIMVGDMFNSGLKARVDALCIEVAGLVGDRSLYVGGRRPGGHGAAWWPEDLGAPTTSGAQNNLRYAFFPEARRLAIGRGRHVDLYDTGAHRIHGVSQQQGLGQDLRFTSQLGTVALHELEAVGSEHVERERAADRERMEGGTGHLWAQTQSQSQSSARHAPSHDARLREAAPARDDPRGGSVSAAATSRSASSDDDVFAKIERLHELQRKGILTEAEFAEKKKELLARI